MPAPPSIVVDAVSIPTDYFESVVAALAEGVLVQRYDGVVLTANRAAADVLGVAPEALIGSTFAFPDGVIVGIDEAPLARADSPGRRCAATGQPSRGDIFGWVRDGRETRWFELDTVPICLPDSGRTYAVMSTVRDVTERIAVERRLDQSERRQALVLANATGGYRILDADGNLLESHPADISDSGFESDHSRPFPHLDGEAFAVLADVFLRVRESPGATESVDIRVMSLTLGERWFECVTTNYLAEPTVAGIVVNYRDVTDRKQAEDSIRFQAHLLDSAGQAIIASDKHGRIVFWNEAAVEIYGWTAAEVSGRFITDVITPWESDDELDEMAARIPKGESWSGDLWIRRRDDSLVPIFLTSTPTFTPDGAFLAVVGVSTDISERKVSEAKLEHQAVHDPLTGLPNRVKLHAELDRLLAVGPDSGREPPAVLFIDIDRFKVINDGIGHVVGDQVLRLTAQRLVAALPNQVVGRFGGDEFVILHAGTTTDPLDTVTDAVLRVFAEPFCVNGHDLHLSASIGVVSATGTDTSDTLLRDADVAMHQAKENGRSQICAFDDRLRRRASKRLSREIALRRALDRDELRIEYQPVLSLPDCAVAGFEALVRWQHPEEGLIGPDTFIPIAEETGLILPIGAWVLEQATSQLARWQRRPELAHAVMAVNLSPRQILSPALPSEVEAAIAASGIDPATLTLEITESSLMQDIERSIRVMHSLKELGVDLAVDDFGTGYSSLMYLKRLPVDGLKIDRSFVSGLGADPDDSAIVRAIVSLGEALDLSVVAEGVESDAQLDALKLLGCAFAQGWLWSPAIPAEAIPTWLARRANSV